MPITQSAKKAIRSSARKRVFNIRRKEALKDAVKNVRKLVTQKKVTENPSETANLLSQAYQAIDKASKRGVIKKNAASRKKSRLTKLLAKHS